MITPSIQEFETKWSELRTKMHEYGIHSSALLNHGKIDMVYPIQRCTPYVTKKSKKEVYETHALTYELSEFPNFKLKVSFHRGTKNCYYRCVGYISDFRPGDYYEPVDKKYSRVEENLALFPVVVNYVAMSLPHNGCGRELIYFKDIGLANPDYSPTELRIKKETERQLLNRKNTNEKMEMINRCVEEYRVKLMKENGLHPAYFS
jgi:hypothetical protein